MKTESEVEGFVRDLVCKELDRRISEASERLPHLCINNYRHPLDQRKQIEGEENESYNRITDKVGLPVIQTIGLCLLESEDPTEWGGTICEEPIDAKKCPYFTPAKGKETILPELESELRDFGWVRENLPEVASLLWVLGDFNLGVPWWKRLLFNFLRIKIEPVHPKIDAQKLLPAPEKVEKVSRDEPVDTGSPSSH
mgnify:CR=1 FL=1|jgi:hypothetical protein